MWKPDGLQSAEMRLLKSASGGFWDVGKSINKWMKREWIQEKNWFWKTTTNTAQKYVQSMLLFKTRFTLKQIFLIFLSGMFWYWVRFADVTIDESTTRTLLFDYAVFGDFESGIKVRILLPNALELERLVV